LRQLFFSKTQSPLEGIERVPRFRNAGVSSVRVILADCQKIDRNPETF
jgi:hypothetical protein